MNITRLEALVLALLPTIVIVGILVLRPHWGLMDDHFNVVVLVPEAVKNGLLGAAWAYAKSDLAWGMFRPTYPLLCWLVYTPGVLLGSTTGFLWNAALSLLAIWYTARVFTRIVGLPIREVLIVNGAFFYQYDLFQHPSLQEKLVIAVGSAFVAACWENKGWKSWAKIALWFVLGIGTKASFMIYFCLGFWALLAAREKEMLAKKARPWLETAILGAAGVALLAFYVFVSRHGTYTSHYFEASIWPNLLSPTGAMFALPVLTFLGATAYTGSWRREGLKTFLPALGVTAFLALFLKWGIAAYIQSLIGTVFACLLVQNARLYLSRLPKAAWLVPVGALALTVASYRTFGSFVRLHDVGAFLDAAPALAQQGMNVIEMPCDEGTIAMQRYLKAQGVSGIEIRHASGNADGKIFFHDRALCPFEGRGDAPPGCRAEPLWTGLWSRSFRVARMHCDGK